MRRPVWPCQARERFPELTGEPTGISIVVDAAVAPRRLSRRNADHHSSRPDPKVPIDHGVALKVYDMANSELFSGQAVPPRTALKAGHSPGGTRGYHVNMRMSTWPPGQTSTTRDNHGEHRLMLL